MREEPPFSEEAGARDAPTRALCERQSTADANAGSRLFGTRTRAPKRCIESRRSSGAAGTTRARSGLLTESAIQLALRGRRSDAIVALDEADADTRSARTHTARR